jgi:hypothetical protein
MSANHDEASRHASAMTAWESHQHARTDEMDGMMGMGHGGMMDPASATSMACHHNDDGTFTAAP